jgi:hypothetical protein
VKGINRIDLSLNGLEEGLYVVKLQRGPQQITRKIIVRAQQP